MGGEFQYPILKSMEQEKKYGFPLYSRPNFVTQFGTIKCVKAFNEIVNNELISSRVSTFYPCIPLLVLAMRAKGLCLGYS